MALLMLISRFRQLVIARYRQAYVTQIGRRWMSRAGEIDRRMLIAETSKMNHF